MLEKINKKKNVNVLSSVQKCDVIHTKNLQIFTRQGIKINNYNTKISKIKNKDDYPNLVIQKQLYNDLSNIFQELFAQEENDDNRVKISQELINVIHNDNSVAQFIDLLYNIKNKSCTEKQAKRICILKQKDKSDAKPLVDLEIKGYHV